MKLEFEIMGLPKVVTNHMVHWRAKYAESKKWKKAVALEVLGFTAKLGWRPLEEANLTLTRFSAREPDFDGLVASFKHVIDGLVEARVIASDKMSVIGQPTYLWEKCAPKKGKIKIKVEAA